MVQEELQPYLDVLREEHVLIQAWKKTASYIRYHNWYSDTLGLDQATADLPTFIGRIRARLQSSDPWQTEPLRIVLAPKSQSWRVHNDDWKPVNRQGSVPVPLRPLAYVGLADQVVATALMLCLANRVETRQKDPRRRLGKPQMEDRHDVEPVVSFGNRLFCDEKDGKLFHRWGSAKLYRAYYQDHQSFISRPEEAAERLTPDRKQHLHVIHADLRQFYDRVRPAALHRAIESILCDGDPAFVSLAKSVLNWEWDEQDKTDIEMYMRQSGITEFRHIALPQGLVASGFFANVMLLDLDDALCEALDTEIAPGLELVDGCRYVDDFRILVEADPMHDIPDDEIQDKVTGWLGDLLQKTADGLELSEDKTQIASLGGGGRPLVLQSAKMKRIQHAISGGFDALGGKDILDSIQGLMQSQEMAANPDEERWKFSPLPDVRDATAARFGAVRFRTTFRSVRPLLGEHSSNESSTESSATGDAEACNLDITRRDLDHDVKVFAWGLIRRWIEDPSNVRLLRVGLDVWPDVDLLEETLTLLRPYAGKGRRGPKNRVAWYCLAEIFRAGATETGFVQDEESLPSGIDLSAYRQRLQEEAEHLVALDSRRIPWYLKQQALLFLATCAPTVESISCIRPGPENRHYHELIQFLRGKKVSKETTRFVTLAILARRAFLDEDQARTLIRPKISTGQAAELARRDPSFFLELGWRGERVPLRIREDLYRIPKPSKDGHQSLAAIVLDGKSLVLRNELSILRFAKKFLECWQGTTLEVITPNQVMLKLDGGKSATIESLAIEPSRTAASGPMYEVPPWCPSDQRWRLQLGFLLRFILAQHPDFTRPVRLPSWKEKPSIYRQPESHWYQRLYGFHNGQSAFGDDWMPMTEWLEGLLLALLRWPGCSRSPEFDCVNGGLEPTQRSLQDRIEYLEGLYGKATETLILPLCIKPPKTGEDANQTLRACVVQTAIPKAEDFEGRSVDLTRDLLTSRREHRNHLSAALAAANRMLTLRKTHTDIGHLDWLILPELAVHPSDVHTHLIPFARQHKAIVLTGLTYEHIPPVQALINSALWIIPQWSKATGWQTLIRRQGKQHLAQPEKAMQVLACLSGSNAPHITGFRPCQWVVNYPWSSNPDNKPVRLTASVCYDATDLGLASDLRGKSDVWAIPALNKDVKTFDQMALALHYHMFQMIIVANNGQYGGSNAYWPKDLDYKRQIFHTHGQPQVSISFLEIDDIDGFLNRQDPAITNDGNRSDDNMSGGWKCPPAGLAQ